jgi:hypothetical protein
VFRKTTILGKGEGLIALMNIPTGDLVAEYSLLGVDGPPYSITNLNAAFSSLNNDQSELLLGLQYSSNPSLRTEWEQRSGSSWDTHQDDATLWLESLWTNHLDGRIFILGSRLNHSCNLNIHYSWNPSTGYSRFYAVRDIKTGEQLTISYLPLST